MAIHLTEKSPSELLSISGVQAYVGQAGVKEADRGDLTLVVLNSQNTVGTVFTQNRFCAAPIYIAKPHLLGEDGVRALVINTSDANAGTGAQGRTDAAEICGAAARQIGCKPSQTLPFFIGMILGPLPVQKIIGTLPSVRPVYWNDVARAIITTDTVSRVASRKRKVGEKHTVRVTGITEGPNMVHPNMATMLALIATSAKTSQPVLQLLTQEIADITFNTVTVDDDTSTNDSSVIMVTGKYGQVKIDNTVDPRYDQLKGLLGSIALELAQAIVRDGEGADKFTAIRVERVADREEAHRVAYAVTRSPLVEAAFSAGSPNLGHLLVAIGYAGITGLDVDRIRIWLGDMLVAEHGSRAKGYTKEQGQAMTDENEITVRIDSQRGKAEATMYTYDLAHKHVSINTDYRS